MIARATLMSPVSDQAGEIDRVLLGDSRYASGDKSSARASSGARWFDRLE
jgi:hypothetical protein